MKVMITGASSGIGKDFAKSFAERGDELFLVARSKNKLEKIKKELSTQVNIIVLDLSNSSNCIKLYNQVKQENIDILINNAGFGVFGEFEKTSLDKELEMIDLNIKAVHILTKLFYTDFKNRNQGYILNVASSASFLPGPLMASYYATKAYVLRLTEALYEELRVDKKHVYVGSLCPGPVDTNFNTVAGVHFSVKPLSSSYVVKYTIKKMFQKKTVIIPGFTMKITYILEKLVPTKLAMKFSYHIQKEKGK